MFLVLCRSSLDVFASCHDVLVVVREFFEMLDVVLLPILFARLHQLLVVARHHHALRVLLDGLVRLLAQVEVRRARRVRDDLDAELLQRCDDGCVNPRLRVEDDAGRLF